MTIPRRRGGQGSSFAAYRQVLTPFDSREALSVAAAAKIAGVTGQTIRRWCDAEGIGRRRGGMWVVSRVALSMFLAGDVEALSAYHRGDCANVRVRDYFKVQKLPRDVWEAWQDHHSARLHSESRALDLPTASTEPADIATPRPRLH